MNYGWDLGDKGLDSEQLHPGSIFQNEQRRKRQVQVGK